MMTNSFVMIDEVVCGRIHSLTLHRSLRWTLNPMLSPNTAESCALGSNSLPYRHVTSVADPVKQKDDGP
jgi:hypothetical protein